MSDNIDIAIATWRLEKWLKTVEVERKAGAESALRILKNYLEEHNVEIIDMNGETFDSGLAVRVINNEYEGVSKENLVIQEMIKPVILENGAVRQFGQVIVGKMDSEDQGEN